MMTTIIKDCIALCLFSFFPKDNNNSGIYQQQISYGGVPMVTQHNIKITI